MVARAPLPREVVRDLLGITRALYRAELALPPPRASLTRIKQLEEIGKQLRRALDLARTSPADSMGGRAAWNWADQATTALGELVRESELMALAVRATAARMRRR